MYFKPLAAQGLQNKKLQLALKRLQTNFVQGRAAVITELDDFEAVRTAAAAIRDRTLNHLDVYLERFERTVTARGGEVHWAETGADVQRIVCEIAARYKVRTAVKSKSMVSEECAINEALERSGVTVTETDLGEYILQLAGERPSHIVAPVLHKNKDEISDLFQAKHHTPLTSDIAALTREAREVLRPRFLAADMGISGANFFIAETGSALIVTNEGNGRLVTTLPRVHVVITGIEKVVPTLEDLATLLRLLPRSATGQSFTNYVSVFTGPKQAEDPDGPAHYHVILLDNGRSSLLGGELQTMLRCIRCGACMNHCPVYQNIGGHAYGWVYPGPMGSVLTPALVGLENALDLPNASTFCGECAVVCPVKIPLPDLMRHLRTRQVQRGLRPWQERLAIKLWSWAALHPRLYSFGARLVARVLGRLGGRKKLLHRLPGLSGWTDGRAMPAPTGRTFRELYRRGQR
jgi:L-lactate dehydrogenase complex protein LldF